MTVIALVARNLCHTAITLPLHCHYSAHFWRVLEDGAEYLLRGWSRVCGMRSLYSHTPPHTLYKHSTPPTHTRTPQDTIQHLESDSAQHTKQHASRWLHVKMERLSTCAVVDGLAIFGGKMMGIFGGKMIAIFGCWMNGRRSDRHDMCRAGAACWCCLQVLLTPPAAVV